MKSIENWRKFYIILLKCYCTRILIVMSADFMGAKLQTGTLPLCSLIQRRVQKSFQVFTFYFYFVNFFNFVLYVSYLCEILLLKKHAVFWFMFYPIHRWQIEEY